MNKSKVFEETYGRYIDEIRGVNLKERALRLGAEMSDDALIIPFFNRKYLVDDHGITCFEGHDVNFAVKVVLCKYILMWKDGEYTICDDLVTFRDFSDSGPLHSYFTTNTNKIIEQSFNHRAEQLELISHALGGEERQKEGYDLAFLFKALPKIPLLLCFNDSDDLFPSKATLLFRKDAELYLDMECLAITGTYLAGLLLKRLQSKKME